MRLPIFVLFIGALLVFAVACGSSGSVAPTYTETPGALSTWTGILLGPASDGTFLLEVGFDKSIPLEGEFDEQDSNHAVKLTGTRRLNPIEVESYEVLSPRSLDDIGKSSIEYLREHHECLVGTTRGVVWNANSGVFEEEELVFKRRLTQDSLLKEKGPQIILSFDMEGKFLREELQPPDLVPCPG